MNGILNIMLIDFKHLSTNQIIALNVIAIVGIVVIVYDVYSIIKNKKG